MQGPPPTSSDRARWRRIAVAAAIAVGLSLIACALMLGAGSMLLDAIT